MRSPTSSDWHFPLVLPETICPDHLPTTHTPFPLAGGDGQRLEGRPRPGEPAFPTLGLPSTLHKPCTLLRAPCTWGMMLPNNQGCFLSRILSTVFRELRRPLCTSEKPVGSKCLHPHFADGKERGNLTCPRSHSRSAVKPGKASKLSASKTPAFPQPKRLSIHGESRLL